MTEAQLQTLLTELQGLNSESECVEFKEARNTYDFNKLGKYFSALSNEANLKDKPCSWLVFGVKDKPVPREIVGSGFRLNRSDLDSLKSEIANKTSNRITFNEIHELQRPEGRVILFEIPASPQGIPVAWEGHYYGRDGEDIGALNIVEVEKIRSQSTRIDWSAQTIPHATINDLDHDAILIAKYLYTSKNPHLTDQASEWDDITFLNKAKITINGKITHTAIILLGNPQAEYLLSPAQAKITWILKDNDNLEADYQHFGPPLLIHVQKVFEKIRNLKYRYILGDSLFPQEIDMYDVYVIREALHNCIAHQDYSLGGKTILVEFPHKLVFSNKGDFIPQDVLEVLHRDSPDTYYRNKFLVDAMVNLNMIDTIGSGIKKMFTLQKKRFFPLPEYSIKASTVSVDIYGEVLSNSYATFLAEHPETTLDDTILLDKTQKGKTTTAAERKRLKEIGFKETKLTNKVTKKVPNKAEDIINTIKNVTHLKDADLIDTEQWEKIKEFVWQQASKVNKNLYQILEYCVLPKTRKEILEGIGVSNQTKNFNKHVKIALELEWLEMTLKDNPKAPNQSYYTTEKGKQLL